MVSTTIHTYNVIYETITPYHRHHQFRWLHRTAKKDDGIDIESDEEIQTKQKNIITHINNISFL